MTQVSSLYVHVPFCQHLCNYCDFYKQKLVNPSEQIQGFKHFLKESWPLHEKLLRELGAEWLPLETIYFGGGTPSLWGQDGAKFWHDFFNIPLKADAEFTMEIDPGTWTEGLIEAWQGEGLNRISIGTQSLHPDFLKILDRNHSVQESLKLLEFCSKNNWNFSLDFLLGVPFSENKNRQILNELDQLLTFRPKHISLYILNARSRYPYISDLPSDEYIRNEYLAVSDYLTSKGFIHYEVSNFALPGYESKHNLKYWRSQNVAALGPTGTGLIVKEENSALRYKWKVSKAEFELETLGAEELNLEKMYLALRTAEGWKTKLTPQLKRLVECWSERGLGFYQGESIQLNARGFVVLDSLMDEIFRP